MSRTDGDVLTFCAAILVIAICLTLAYWKNDTNDRLRHSQEQYNKDVQDDVQYYQDQMDNIAHRSNDNTYNVVVRDRVTP